MHTLSFALFTVVAAAGSEKANFVIEAPDAEMAKEVTEAAELFRESLAMEWLGRPLPRWSKPCSISVAIDDTEGGGSTTFNFSHGEVFGWKLVLTGTRERILAEHLPQEVMHMVLASHFRRPMDRWIHEGLAAQVASATQKAEQLRRVREAVIAGDQIPLSGVVGGQAGEGEQDLVHDEAATLVQFLLHLGSKQRLIEFIEAGENNAWPAALKTHYGFADWDALDQAWMAWLSGKGIRGKTVDTADRIESVTEGRSTPVDEGTVLFFMADWCGPCQSMVPVARSLQTAGYAIRRIDIDREPELAKKFGVTSLPTFVRVGDSSESRRHVGVATEEELLRLLNR